MCRLVLHREPLAKWEQHEQYWVAISKDGFIGKKEEVCHWDAAPEERPWVREGRA